MAIIDEMENRSLAWTFPHFWPQRAAALIETGIGELVRCWFAVLNAFDESGYDVGYKTHPGESIFGGVTSGTSPAATGG